MEWWQGIDYWVVWDTFSYYVLQGLPWRLVTWSLFSTAFWLGVYRQRVRLAFLCYVLSLMTAYVHILMQTLGLG